MARRKKTNVIEDLLAIASRLPWWASLLIAMISWPLLHTMAIAGLPQATGAASLGPMMIAGLFKGFATFSQYALPAIFGLGAVMSATTSLSRRKLFTQVTTGNTAKQINQLTWIEFEQFIGEWFRRQGYTVAETGGGGADGGVDIVLRKGTETTLVQCKHWRAQCVGVKVVRELYGVMAAHGAANGIVVASGHYTDDAEAFSRGRNIELVSSDTLAAWFSNYQAERLLAENSQPELWSPPTQSQPACPVCRGTMVRRTAKRGSNAGNVFWGCTNFPSCRGIRQAE